MNPADVRHFLSHLTSQPGVYKMLDDVGDILYVGKALNLKKRVSSYFNNSDLSVKTRSLVSQIASIDVTVTRSETEALILENAWIKLHRPKYNILMRDDKSYPFIYISNHPIYPNISVIRRKKKPSTGEFFGPFPSTTAVRDTMNLLHKVFKIRNCTDTYFSARSRPCLQYQIKRCSAPCTHLISPLHYQQSIADAKRFLQGKSQQIIEELSSRMQTAVDRLAYEEAAVIRDQITALRTVQEQQYIAQSKGDADIIVIIAQPGFACVLLAQVRCGDVISSESYFPVVPEQSLVTLDDDTLWQQVFSAFLAQYYFDAPERIPERIITDHKVVEKGVLQQVLTELRGKSCHIVFGQRGAPAKWLDFAHNNIQQAIVKHNTATHTMQSRISALEAFMQMAEPITRIECFDVSHFQGDATVASCVVFDIHGPCKREYRRFNIHGVTPGDDYAAMEQALTRRYQDKDRPIPEVLIVDGGLGQLSVARRVLAQLALDKVVLLGVAKGRTRKSGWEQLILAAEQGEQYLAEHSPARHLIQYIRDEAHRFAIAAHRNKRDKQSLRGSLDEVPGIGPKRRKLLLQRFGGLRELRNASREELLKVRGISQALAERIYLHFHDQD